MITVLLATYNGQQFIRQQLDSLLEQTRTPDRILIHDDCSSDGTVDILREYAQSYPGLIEVVLNARNLGGSARNFMSMMTVERDDYIMLCDQDDVWLPHKVQLAFDSMVAMEERWGRETPCLTHTDLAVVDESLRPMGTSFKQSTFADYGRTSLRDQVIQNTATGCTIMYNKALAALITQVPEHMVMHDWWISLIAAAFGHMGHSNARTVLYRQHSTNQVGVTDMRTLRYKLHRLLNPSQVRSDIAKTYPQAAEFRVLFADRLNGDQMAFLGRYCAIPQRRKFGRVAEIVRLGVWKTGVSRNIAYLLFC